jgi:hypothetical protein
LATLSPEERRLRSKVAGLTATVGATNPRTLAARRQLEKGKREAEQWLRDQVEAGRLRPLEESDLVKIATIIRLVNKVESS